MKAEENKEQEEESQEQAKESDIYRLPRAEVSQNYHDNSNSRHRGTGEISAGPMLTLCDPM